MHVKAKKIAIAGLLLAFTIVCIAMGSVIEIKYIVLLAGSFLFCRNYLSGIWRKDGSGILYCRSDPWLHRVSE